jgi:predicted transcriptional regulator
LEWAWDNGIEEFTHNELLDRDVISYRGSRRRQVWSVSSTLRRMHEAGLLTRLAAGKGRRASLYTPISREEYQRKLRQLVLI